MFVHVLLQVVVNNDDDEEEKEVDPSLVGSLDNVYTEAPGTMPGEDPFKHVPMMLDNEKPSNLMEMEKTLEAMEASIDNESSQELDSSDDMSSLDSAGMTRRPRAKQLIPNDSLNRVLMNEGGVVTEHRALNQQQQQFSEDEERGTGRGGANIMPDLVTSGPTTPPDIQLSSRPAPDLTANSRNPPNTTSSRISSQSSPGTVHNPIERDVDLLHNTSSSLSGDAPTSHVDSQQPLDLTDGLLALQVGPGDGGREET